MPNCCCSLPDTYGYGVCERCPVMQAEKASQNAVFTKTPDTNEYLDIKITFPDTDIRINPNIFWLDEEK